MHQRLDSLIHFAGSVERGLEKVAVEDDSKRLKVEVLFDAIDAWSAKEGFQGPVCLIGHSGCGKSTVLSIAAGLLDPTEGGVLIDGREIPGPGTDRGVVFQSPCLLPWMTAFGNVMLAVEQAKPDASRKVREEVFFAQCGT